MKKYLSEYQASNPEKFNGELFSLREKEDVLEAVRECFRTLEILDEVKLVSVEMDTDESQFDPIVKKKGKDSVEYYKPILQSRLNRIRYKFVITPTEEVKMKPILSDDEEGMSLEREYKNTENSYYREGILYINKLVDNWFYINEGCRYFLINQIVDNATYGTGNSVSLKSLLMPITLQKKPDVGIVINSLSSSNSYTVPVYNLCLFAKHINVLLYYLAKYSFNDLIRMDISDPEEVISERQKRRCPEIIDKVNNFFGTDFKFSDNLSELMEEGREVFRTPGENGVYISVDKEKLESRDANVLSILGCFFEVRANGKQKKKTEFSYDELISPIFWVDILASYFTANTDPVRKFEKIKTMLVSLDRLTDESTKRVLRLPEEDKKNTLAVIRYMLRNFDYLNTKDPNNFDDKRIRIVESMLYPLRSYFSAQTYRVLNATTRSKQVLDRIFSNLSPTYLLKTTVVSELLRYYNATNELDILSVLKCTQTGPQSLSKTVSNLTRDVQPSQVGRLSLVNASASNPGLSSMICPFCELEPGMYFAPENDLKESEE